MEEAGAFVLQEDIVRILRRFDNVTYAPVLGEEPLGCVAADGEQGAATTAQSSVL